MSYKELNSISKLKVRLLRGDFIKDLNQLEQSNKNRLYLFLGSNLGNFDNKTAKDFLKIYLVL